MGIYKDLFTKTMRRNVGGGEKT